MPASGGVDALERRAPAAGRVAAVSVSVCGCGRVVVGDLGVDLGVVLAHRGARAMQLPAALGVAVRRTGEQQAAVAVGNLGPETPLVEVVGFEHVGRRVHVRERPAAGLCRGGELHTGVREQPGVERGVEDLLGLRTHERVGSRERLGQGLVVEDGHHLLHLLRRRHHRDVAVGTRVQAVGEEIPGAGAARHVQGFRLTAVVPHEEAPHAHRRGAQRLGRRAVDVRAFAACARTQHAGEPAECGGVTDRAQGDDAGHLHRHDIGTSLRVGQPPGGLRDQVGPAVARVRAVDAEAADGGDDEARATGAQLVTIHAERGEVARAGTLDDEVGVVEEPGDALAADITGDVGHHGTLVRVEVQQRQGPTTAQLAATRRLHLDHVGAEIGEDLRRVRAGGFVGEVDDPHVAQQLAHAMSCAMSCVPCAMPGPGP